MVYSHTIPGNNRGLQPIVSAIARVIVIPYRETIGGYNSIPPIERSSLVIPYRETIGGYNILGKLETFIPVIPYRETIGGYNSRLADLRRRPGHTIPRNNWKLQARRGFRHMAAPGIKKRSLIYENKDFMHPYRQPETCSLRVNCSTIEPQ